MGVATEDRAVPMLSVPGQAQQGQTYHDKYVVVYNFKDVGE